MAAWESTRLLGKKAIGPELNAMAYTDLANGWIGIERGEGNVDEKRLRTRQLRGQITYTSMTPRYQLPHILQGAPGTTTITNSINITSFTTRSPSSTTTTTTTSNSRGRVRRWRGRRRSAGPLKIALETSTSPGLPRGLGCCRIHTFTMLLVFIDVKRQVALVQLSLRSVGWIKFVPSK